MNMHDENDQKKIQKDREMKPVDSFVFYKSYFETAQYESAEDRLKFYEAVMKYALYGEVPSLESIGINAWKLFNMAREPLKSNNRKRVAGYKGGRPRKTSDQNE